MDESKEMGCLCGIAAILIGVFFLYGAVSAFFDFANFIIGGGLCF